MAKAKTKEKVMAAATKTVSAVECDVCGAVHLVTSKDFVVFYGNITVGLDTEETPVIGGNIDERGQVSGSRICCMRKECLIKKLGPLAHAIIGTQKREPREPREG